MTPKKLSTRDFLNSFKNVPRVALNILITNSKGEVLLTQRAIPPKLGSWHYPGGFILRNESLDKCFKRISTKELGVTLDPDKKVLLGVFENIKGDPRGHIIDLIYAYKVGMDTKFSLTRETSKITFFDKLPLKIGFNHRDILRKLGYK